MRVIGDYADHSEWWEILVKPAIASICKDFSSKLAKERKCTKRFLYASSKIFLRQENWAEVARAKESIRRMLVYDMTWAQIRSRQSEYAEEERGSLYHYNKERKNKNLKQMKVGAEVVTDDDSKIEELSISFYDFFCETFYYFPHLLYICLFPDIIYFPIPQLLFSVPLQLLSQLCG